MSQQSESDSELRLFEKSSFNAILEQLGPEDSDVINRAIVSLTDSQQLDTLQQTISQSECQYQQSHESPTPQSEQSYDHTQHTDKRQLLHIQLPAHRTPTQRLPNLLVPDLQRYPSGIQHSPTSTSYYTPSVVSEAQSPTDYYPPSSQSHVKSHTVLPHCSRPQLSPNLGPQSRPVTSPVSLSIPHTVPLPPLLSPGHAAMIQRQTTDGVFEGDYAFEVTIPSKSKITKSMPFIFSEPLNRLYVQMGVQCPIRFRVSKVTDGLYVRAVPMYIDHQNRSYPVTACHVHTDVSADITGLSPIQRLSSWMRPGPAVYGAQTLQDSHGHFTLLVPWFVSENTLEVTYSFACRNSCIGGPNRRKTSVAFTLENAQGDILGKKVMEVRVISSPGRDREKDEERYSNEKVVQEHPKLKRKHVTFNDTVTSVSPPKKYYLEMDLKQTYDLLAPIRDSLELTQKLPESEIINFMASRSRKLQPLRCVNTDNVCTTSTKSSTCLHASSSRPSPSAYPDSTQNDNDQKISTWLKTFGFEAYADSFSDAGYVNVGQILNFTMEDIDQLRIAASQARIIIDNLRRFGGDDPLSQPSGGGEALGLIRVSAAAHRLKQELSGSSTSSNED